MDYVIVTRGVSKKRFRAEPGPTRFLRVPKNAKTPLPSHADKTKGANPEEADPVGDILIFIQRVGISALPGFVWV